MLGGEFLLLVVVMSAGRVSSTHSYEAPSSGTEFYFMFMPNDQIDFNEDPVTDPYSIIVGNINSENNTVQIVFAGENITLVIPQFQSITYVFPMEVMEHVVGATPVGIYINSRIRATVTAVNRQKFTTDTYNIYPKTSLSLSYIAACFADNAQSQIGIIGVLDATEVDITLPIHTSGKFITVEYKGLFYTNAPGGKDSYRVNLNEHETYLLSSAGDLTGTIIRGNKRIAVFSGNNRARVDGRSRDHLIEQMIPAYNWINEWYIASTPNRTMGDKYRLLTSFLGGSWVNITLNNGTSIQNLRIESSRSFLEVLLPSEIYAKFTCSQKCLVYQISRSTSGSELGDPSEVVAANPFVYGSGATAYIFRLPASVNGLFQANTVIFMLTNISEANNLAFYRDDVNSITPTITWDCSPSIKICVGKWILYSNSSFEVYSNNTLSGWLYGNDDRNSYAHNLGLPIYSPSCLGPDRDLAKPGDAVDNDCDSNIDEEPNAFDGIDNDGDGTIDEDVDVGLRVSDSFGKDYLIMFMENWVEVASNIPLEVFIAGLEQEGATVNIDLPLENGTRVSAVTTVPGSGMTRLDFPSYMMQHGTGKESKTIRIRSSSNIAVFGMNKEVYSTDGFLAIPINAFGMEYRSVSYYPATVASQVGIVAPSDGTLVSIKFPPADGKRSLNVEYDGVSYTNNDTLTVSMDANESLQLQDIATRGDLSGALIQSNKPVGVFSGNVRAFVQYNEVVQSGSRDHLVEQLPPTASWGKQFAMFSIPQRTVGDVFKIVASQDNTNVIITTRRAGVSYNTSINLPYAGSNYQHNLFKSQSYLYVMSDKPILVVHITRSQQTLNNQPVCDPLPEPGEVWESNCAGDPSMIYVPPIELYSNRYIFMTPTISDPKVSIDYTHWLLVIAEQQYVSGLTLNDNTTFFSDAVWELIPAPSSATHGILMATAVRLRFNTQYQLYHSDADAKIMGILYGYGDRESYGFPIGLNFQECEPTLSVDGDEEDNDCDGRIDEELCYDREDNDKDGRIDEDCYEIVTHYKYFAVFMENDAEYPGYYPPRLHTASQECQDVLVTVPRYPYEGSTDTFAQRVCGSKLLEVGLRPDVRHIGSGLQYKGIIIESFYPLDIFGSNVETFSSDAFTLIELSGLGVRYITAHYTARTPYAAEQFAITPAFDDTSVTVALPQTLKSPIEFDGTTYEPGATITFMMSRGESAQIQSIDGGLSGSQISSNKEIAVFSGNVRTWVDSEQLPSKSRDHLVEQIFPDYMWSNFMAVPTSPGRNISDTFIIAATSLTSAGGMVQAVDELGTIYSRYIPNGGVIQLTLPSGDSKCYSFYSNMSVQIMRATWSQIDKSEQTDPALLLALPFHFGKSNYTFSLPMLSGGDGSGKQKAILQLIVPYGDVDAVEINGKKLESNWLRYTGNIFNFFYTNYELENSIEWLTVSNQYPFLAYLYGSGDRESYAMPCGYGLP